MDRKIYSYKANTALEYHLMECDSGERYLNLTQQRKNTGRGRLFKDMARNFNQELRFDDEEGFEKWCSRFIDTRFICEFKVGDNLVYNASILNELYKSGEELLIKPKLIISTSLIEAAMYDFLRRIREHTIEFKYLADTTRRKIREIKPEKLKTLKQHIFKFREFKLIGENRKYYDDLEKLIELRNRVHLQNEKGLRPKDDRDVFNSEKLRLSEKCTEYVLRYLSVCYPRHDDYVGGVRLPWSPHYQ